MFETVYATPERASWFLERLRGYSINELCASQPVESFPAFRSGHINGGRQLGCYVTHPVLG